MPNPFPSAWVSRRVREAANWGRLYSELSVFDLADEAWFLAEERRSAARPARRDGGRGAGTAARRSSSTTARAS